MVATSSVALSELNRLDRPTFVAALGGVFEASPWIAETACERRPFRSVAELHAVMCEVVAAGGRDRQEALILAHPDLAGKEAAEGTLTRASEGEQTSAGLDRLERATADELRRLNGLYRDRFGFSCIVCVRQHGGVEAILAAIRRRLPNDRAAEIDACLREIAEIARLRLLDAVDDDAVAADREAARA